MIAQDADKLEELCIQANLTKAQYYGKTQIFFRRSRFWNNVKQ